MRAVLPMLLCLSMMACAQIPTVTLAPAAPTASPDGGPVIKAYVCNEIVVVRPHLGKVTPDYKPDLSKADVLAALDRADWFDYLHHIVGDTNETIRAVDLNNAVLDALCSPPATKPGS